MPRSSFVFLLLRQCYYNLPIVMKEKHMFAYLQQIVFTGKSGEYSYIQRIVQQIVFTANNSNNCSTRNTVFEPLLQSPQKSRIENNESSHVSGPTGTLVRIRVRRRGLRWFWYSNHSCECNTVKVDQ